MGIYKKKQRSDNVVYSGALNRLKIEAKRKRKKDKEYDDDEEGGSHFVSFLLLRWWPFLVFFIYSVSSL